jgi:predicted metalloendopeptidase
MKKIISNAVLFVLPALIATSAVQAQDNTAKKEPGINVNFMDKKVKPTDDFFRYVNGTWLDNTQIPNDKTRWGSFDELRQKTDTDALNILKEAAKNPIYKSNTDQGKAINLYKSIMDTVARNKQGIAPLKPYLAKINAVKNAADLQALLIQMAPQGGLGFFGVGIGVDAKNSNRNVINVGPGSVGLPDRDYYVSEDADSKEKRAKYVLHLTKMLQLIGEKPAEAQANADKILAFETTMSKPRFDRVERRDRRKTYNPMSVADLQKLTPSVNWGSYIKGVGISKLDSVIVSQPKYMSALESIFKENKNRKK